MTKPSTLSASHFDARTVGAEKVWGLPAIAQVLGRSVDFTRSIAAEPGVPIYRPAGRYFAFRSELIAWLRTKQS